MAIFTEETSLYEILIRVLPSGAWAAQYQNLNIVKKDGVVISETTGDVAPLDTEDAAAFAIASQLIGDTAAKNMTLLAQLHETLAAQATTIEDLQAQLSEAAAKESEAQGIPGIQGRPEIDQPLT